MVILTHKPSILNPEHVSLISLLDFYLKPVPWT